MSMERSSASSFPIIASLMIGDARRAVFMEAGLAFLEVQHAGGQ